MAFYHGSRPRNLPDAGRGCCCIGAATRGPGFCTCWEPVHDLPQSPPVRGQLGARDSMCEDCAFRPDSPERRGDDRYANASDEDLADLPDFACHQGMRRVLRWRHPAGVEVEALPGVYDPPHVFGIPCKADGTPADRCAGLALQSKLLEGFGDG